MRTRRDAATLADVFASEWVFAYGSLIWNPEIDYERAELGRVRGYHRAFCISSTHYRGTPERPGVVLGLDRGGSCIGVAYRLREATRDAALRRIHERESLGDVYLPRIVDVFLAGGGHARALTYVADHASPMYARLSDDEVLVRLETCWGVRGSNREYAVNTLHSLDGRGVHDERIARVVARL